MMQYKSNVIEKLASGIKSLFNKHNIDFICGHASFVSDQEITIDNKQSLFADKFIIATGSKAINIPNVTIDEQNIVSSTGVLSLTTIPKSMVVIGAGYIGLELGSVWSRLGSKVHIIEYADSIVPNMDIEVRELLYKTLQKQNIQFSLATQVLSVTHKNNKQTLLVKDNNGEHNIHCDLVLSCAGRKPNTDGLNLQNVHITPDDKGFIAVNSNYQTTKKNIYAIGDVIGGSMLAHKAEEEGIAVAELISGQKPHVNYACIPSIIYTNPEASSVGQQKNSYNNKTLTIRLESLTLPQMVKLLLIMISMGL